MLFLLVIPFSVNAQENSEQDSLNWKVDLSLSGIYQAGNVETKIFRASTNFTIKTYKQWVFETKNSYVYQEFGKTKADEDILSLNFLNFNPTKKLYPLMLSFISTNYRREIDLRYLIGVGVSYRIVDKEDHSLIFSLSTELEHTEFGRSTFNKTEYNGDASIRTFRGTFWVNGTYELIAEKLIVSNETYYQPSLSLDNNYRWQSNTSLHFPIWDFLDINITYLYTYENIVIVGQKPEDRFLTFGFTLKGYK